MHKNEIPVGKAKNLIGQKFGELKVLYRVENKGNHTMWHCICDCGNECDVASDSLQAKKGTKSCGCLSKPNLLSNRYGRLTVIDKCGSRDRMTFWKCKCDCGNIIEVSTHDLRRGHTKSCGCLKNDLLANRKRVDLSNQRFGHLTALYPTKKRSVSGCVIWHCQCDCGKAHEVPANCLISGTVMSCGCAKESSGEEKIASLLNENDIPYYREYKFETCIFPDTKRFARFDFYVNNSYIIEFDGEQHFNYSNSGWNTEEKYLKTKKHDDIKNKWCKDNNIPIIRIPYKRLKEMCIEDLKLETSQFIQ